MRRIWTKQPLKKRAILIGLPCFMALLIVCGEMGYRLNVSSSLPLGVYHQTKEAIQLGSYIDFCPPVTPLFQEAKYRSYFAPGICPGGMGHIFKKVAAMGGSIVTMDKNGMRIDGKIVPLSEPISRDSKMRPLHFWAANNYALHDYEVILMGENKKSFDSRYFGPIAQKQIVSVIEPVMVWGEPS